MGNRGGVGHQPPDHSAPVTQSRFTGGTIGGRRGDARKIGPHLLHQLQRQRGRPVNPEAARSRIALPISVPLDIRAAGILGFKRQLMDGVIRRGGARARSSSPPLETDKLIRRSRRAPDIQHEGFLVIHHKSNACRS